MDDIDTLEYDVTSMSTSLFNVSAGVLAFLRLEKVNKTALELRSVVNRLTEGPVNESQLAPLKEEVESLHKLSSSMITKVVFLFEIL